jgi:hypothetical protein
MSDPQLQVDIDGDPVDAAEVATEPEQVTWLVKSSDPRWQVWRDHNRRRPPTRAEKRGRLAAATAATIIGVLGVGGALSYNLQWTNVQNDAVREVETGSGGMRLAIMVSEELASGSGMQVAVDRVQQANYGSAGLFGIENGEVTGVTDSARTAAANPTCLAEGVVQEYDLNTGQASSTFVSPSCVYTSSAIVFSGKTALVVNVVDLTPARNRLNTGYLAYGLIGLGVAGASAGAVWTGLGRRLNRKIEPDEV